MTERESTDNPLRITSVIASLSGGGIGPVWRYAANGIARQTDWNVTLLCLRDPPEASTKESSGLRIVGLGLDGNSPRSFLEWLAANRQDLVITSDVCQIEPSFRFIPPTTRHVIQIHDSGRRYRAVAVRNAAWVDGVTCVAHHIEEPLRRELGNAGFSGLLRTVYNGADFPPLIARPPSAGPLRLLFMGRLDPLKGVFDFVPLLRYLHQWKMPFTLNIVGGENPELRRQFERKGLSRFVTWTGTVPHERCYQMAAESDIFLMPSRKEAFGMATIEAMSMGCVPIAYDFPSGSTEIIEHEKSGLLVPLGEIRAWAERIRELHENRDRLSRLSAAAISRARDNFNAERMASGIVRFLKDVVAHASKTPAKRDCGLPPEEPTACAPAAKGYQRLPKALRERIRNCVGAHPKLCHWVINR